MSVSPYLSALIPNSTLSFPPQKDNPLSSAGFIVLMVVASLCAILGAIYAYLYYTRINPKSSRARKYVEQSAGGEDGGNGSTYTHLLLFRKA